jgi:hypothetical protein
MYYLFLCYSYISYILALEGSVGGLLKTFTAPPALHPKAMLDNRGARLAQSAGVVDSAF